MFELPYPFRTANFSKFYTFESVSEDRTVVKVVQFSRVWDNIYNLGLADFEQGQLKFQEPSNNFDTVRVLGTVASIVRQFTELYPEREVFIKGESRRMKLFALVVQRRWSEIEQDFWVWGLVEDEWETFVPGVAYEALKIKRK